MPDRLLATSDVPTERLLELANLALNRGLDLRSVLQQVTDTGKRLTGAEVAAFFYAGKDEQGERMDAVALSGAGADAFPEDAPVRHTALFAPTFTDGEAVRVDDVLADARYGTNASHGLPPRHAPVRSYLATPVLTHDKRSLGALLFSHSRPGMFSAEDEATAQAVAAQAAVAIDNARLFAAEVTARARAERAARRLALLQSIAGLLASAASTSDIAEAVPAAVGDVIDAATCSVLLLDEHSGRFAAHTGGQLQPAGWQREVIAMGLAADTALSRVVHSRQPLYVSATEMARMPGVAHLDLERLSAAMATPLLGRDRRVLGLLTATWVDGAGIDEADRQLVVSVAAQVAQALERAELFDAEQSAREDLAVSVKALGEVAHALQQALLPHDLPMLDRVEVAHRYLPATAADVGGDWYDVVRAEGKVVFVIGDVQGHTFAAAGLMGQLRTAVRAYVSEGHPPGEALDRTNDVMLDLSSELFATCCLAQLDEGTGELVVATAGHPPPLLVHECGAVTEVEVEPGPPLGIARGSEYAEVSTELSGPTHLVLYTDGLVESPGGGVTGGLPAVCDAAREARCGGAEAVAQEILGGIDHDLTDDVALLVLDYGGPDVGLDVASISLDAEARAAGEGRRFLRTQLCDWRVPADVVDTAELVLSELVTNAVVHTDGPATVALRRDESVRRLYLSVHDTSTRRPLEREADDGALGGRGLAIVAALAETWGVSLQGVGKTVWAELALTD